VKEVIVTKVTTPNEKRIFLTFPWQIYKQDRLWVPPLLPDRKKILDPIQGPFFKHGRLDCYIAWR